MRPWLEELEVKKNNNQQYAGRGGNEVEIGAVSHHSPGGPVLEVCLWGPYRMISFKKHEEGRGGNILKVGFFLEPKKILR